VAIEIRPILGYDELTDCVRVRNETMPDDPESANMVALVRATELDRIDLYARVEGQVVGTGTLSGDPHSEAATHPYIEINVLAEHRGRGVGSALLGALSDYGKQLGYLGFVCEARVDDPASIAFLERRGYVEEMRTDQYALDLAGAGPATRADDVEIVWLADRFDLVPAMHAVAQEAYPGLSYRAARRAETLEDWRTYELGEPTLRLELTAVALVDGEVVGYSPLIELPPLNAGRHRMIVRAGPRQREVAAALASAQAEKARELGLAKIISWRRNEVGAHVQALLGYRLRTTSIGFRGPLVPSRS